MKPAVAVKVTLEPAQKVLSVSDEVKLTTGSGVTVLVIIVEFVKQFAAFVALTLTV